MQIKKNALISTLLGFITVSIIYSTMVSHHTLYYYGYSIFIILFFSLAIISNSMLLIKQYETIAVQSVNKDLLTQVSEQTFKYLLHNEKTFNTLLFFQVSIMGALIAFIAKDRNLTFKTIDSVEILVSDKLFIVVIIIGFFFIFSMAHYLTVYFICTDYNKLFTQKIIDIDKKEYSNRLEKENKVYELEIKKLELECEIEDQIKQALEDGKIDLKQLILDRKLNN